MENWITVLLVNGSWCRKQSKHFRREEVLGGHQETLAHCGFMPTNQTIQALSRHLECVITLSLSGSQTQWLFHFHRFQPALNCLLISQDTVDRTDAAFPPRGPLSFPLVPLSCPLCESHKVSVCLSRFRTRLPLTHRGIGEIFGVSLCDLSVPTYTHTV